MQKAHLKFCHRYIRVFASLWLTGLLVATAASCPDAPTAAALPTHCQQLPRVCVDQSSYVLYDNRHNPRHELFEGLPPVQLKSISVNYLGFDDLWDTEIQHPNPVLRPASSEEESPDLSHPQFSSCTVPLVLYASRLYSHGDLFVNTVAPLYMWQLNRRLDRRITLVVDTFGMKLQRLHRFLLSPFSAFRITSLSHMSSRLPLARPEHYNPDGQHVRCFSNLLLCQMSGGGGSAAVELARTAPIHHPLWSTGQAILSYYKQRLPAIDPTFADKSKLKVLIAAMPRGDNIRAIINQEQVWTWCTKFKAPAGVPGWNGTACLLHEFGKNLLSDLLYTSQADVLLGLHGDSMYWGFFMAKHSSVVEIRPRGFAGPQANQHMKEVTAADGHSVLWWGIDVVNPAHSAPSQLESQGRGDQRLWARERHVFVRLMACQKIFERIAQSRANVESYHKYKEFHEHHITDMLEPANDSGDYSNVSAATVGGSTEGPQAVGTAAAPQPAESHVDKAAAGGAAKVAPSH